MRQSSKLLYAGSTPVLCFMLLFIAGFNTAAVLLGVPLLHMLSDTTKLKRTARQFESAHAEYTCHDDPFSSSGRTPGSEPGN